MMRNRYKITGNPETFVINRFEDAPVYPFELGSDPGWVTISEGVSLSDDDAGRLRRVARLNTAIITYQMAKKCNYQEAMEAIRDMHPDWFIDCGYGGRR